jgi:hypothetical protein
MRILSVLAALAFAGAAAPAAAADHPYDPKALARYDASYVQCEKRFADMVGHRDEAYLSLWRIKPSPKTAARLAETRSASAYKAEQRRVAQAAAKPAAPAASSPLERQCRGLWGEYGRMPG